MTLLDWPTIRKQACTSFHGQTPRREDEARIIEHFETSPSIVLEAIGRVADAMASGTVKWGWSALAARLDRQADTPAAGLVVVDTSSAPDRDRRVSAAEQWVRTAGVHYDRPSEIEHELFGSATLNPTIVERTGEMIESQTPGVLGPWHDDRELRRRMVDLWRQERPRGERCDEDAEKRMARYRADREQLHQAVADARTELDARQASRLVEVLDPDPEPDVFAKGASA